MQHVTRLLDNSVAQKAVAAATGIGLLAFVAVHMAGNLQAFLGQDALNAYAVKLKSLGPLLWIARLGLLALVAVHISMTVRLAFRNRAARHGRYMVAKRQASTRSSRTMIVSGTVILAFILFHLSHFTFGWIQPHLYELTDSQGRHDVYSMVTLAFQHWGIAFLYLIAMFFLFAHLSHAIFSAFQSLGLAIAGKDTSLKQIARVVAAVTILGFASVPVAALVGWLRV